MLIVVTFFALISFLFPTPIINLYGAKGDLIAPSLDYYLITMIGVPFLSIAMTGNNNLRAEGKANQAMLVLLIPSILNMVLDGLFIAILDWGIKGAAWATAIAYISSGMYIIYYFMSGKTELTINLSLFRLKRKIVAEIASIGMISILRNTGVSILTIALNHALLTYGKIDGIGGENAVSSIRYY